MRSDAVGEGACLQSALDSTLIYDASMALQLVTGIAGFIGSALARALLAEGHQVRGIDNLATGSMSNLSEIIDQIDFRQADLLDPAAMASACVGVDCVFHEAALPSVPRSVIDPVASNQANVDGTLNLLVAARDAKVRRVVYAASSSAYGDTPTLPKHEGMTPNPISPYAVAKLTGELYMRSFYRVYGLETVCLRYFNVFGPRQAPNSPYSGVLAKFITNMLKGETPTIYGDGEQSRDFTYIDNVVRGNLLASGPLAAGAPAEKVAGEVFNCACGERVTLNQTVEMLRGITGYTGPVEYAQDRSGDIKHSLADITRAESAFGYRPVVNFDEGLRRTVEWYREQIAAGRA